MSSLNCNNNSIILSALVATNQRFPNVTNTAIGIAISQKLTELRQSVKKASKAGAVD